MPEGVTTLRRIVSRESNRPVIEAIRAEPDEEKQYAQKQQLRAFTSVSLLRHRKKDTSFAERLAAQWPMLAGDVDKGDNPHADMAKLKVQISALSFVLLCAYSVRGGLWFVVRLPEHQTPQTLAAHFRYLQKLFGGYNKKDRTYYGKFGVTLDSSKGGNPTDLRFVSYDAAPYINDAATVMTGTYTPPKPKPSAVRQQDFSGTDEGELLTRVVRYAEGATEGNRHTALNKAAFTAGGYIAAGRLNEYTAQLALETVASEWPTFGKSQKTIRDGIRTGQQKPLYAEDWSNDYRPPVRSARPAYPLPGGMVMPPAEDAPPPRPNNTMILDGRMIYGELLPDLPLTDLPALWDEPTPPKGVKLFTPGVDSPAESCPDAPNEPDAKPTICAVKFHQWQQQHPYFGRHGVASLQPQPSNLAFPDGTASGTA